MVGAGVGGAVAVETAAACCCCCCKLLSRGGRPLLRFTMIGCASSNFRFTGNVERVGVSTELDTTAVSDL